MSSIPNAIRSTLSRLDKAGATGKPRLCSPRPDWEQNGGGSQQPSCPTCVMQCIQGTFWLCLEAVKPSLAPSYSNCVYCLSQVAGMAGPHQGRLGKIRFLVSLMGLSRFRQEGKQRAAVRYR